MSPNGRIAVEESTLVFDGFQLESRKRLTNAQATGLDDPLAEIRLAEILDDYLLALEAGRTVDIEAFIEQHRDLEIPLREYLDGLELIRDLASDDSCHSRQPAVGCEANFVSGEKLGPYVLGPMLGRGAMGIVYRGYDTQHNRQVAVKVLAFGSKLDTSCIDRFRREAKTAALLEHPNVVPVYAVGCERGVNYYAMQWIAGESLDQRLAVARQHPDELQLDGTICSESSPLCGPDKYRRIAQLGATAASALHATHLAGVIHRDIKPSNLLLGNDGQLWVTDFGLARVQAEAGLTRTGELVGTVRYMSPEQARGKGDMIDARTDVYALGATLFELVTKVAAFPGDDMLDLLRAIQTSEPPNPRVLDPRIPRDLETIILRAMRPRAADRYPTALAMAEDLNRFVAGKSIRGQPVTHFERIIAWARNHKRFVISLMAIWASIVAVSLITTVSVVVLQSKTSAALKRSDQLYRQARDIVQTLGFRSAKKLAGISAAEHVRQDILLDTMNYYQQFIDNSADDPRLQHDVASTRLELARLKAYSHSFDEADKAYRTATEQLRLVGECLMLVQALNEWALLASEHSEQSTALSRLDEALQWLSSTAHLPASDRRNLPIARALTHNNRGVVLLRQYRIEESARELKESITILQSIPPDALRNSDIGADLADAFSNLSVLLSEAKEFAKAVVAAEKSLDIRVADKGLSERGGAAEYQSRLAITYNNLAAFHWKAARVDESIVAYQRSVDLMEQAIRNAPERAESRDRLAVTLNNLGIALVSQHAYSSAEQVFKRAQTLAQPPVAADPGNVEAVRRLAGILTNEVVLLRKLRRIVEAEELEKEIERLSNAASNSSTATAAARARRPQHYSMQPGP